MGKTLDSIVLWPWGIFGAFVYILSSFSYAEKTDHPIS